MLCWPHSKSANRSKRSAGAFPSFPPKNLQMLPEARSRHANLLFSVWRDAAFSRWMRSSGGSGGGGGVGLAVLLLLVVVVVVLVLLLLVLLLLVVLVVLVVVLLLVV